MHSKSHSEYKCEYMYIRHGVITYNLLKIYKSNCNTIERVCCKHHILHTITDNTARWRLSSIILFECK